MQLQNNRFAFNTHWHPKLLSRSSNWYESETVRLDILMEVLKSLASYTSSVHSTIATSSLKCNHERSNYFFSFTSVTPLHPLHILSSFFFFFFLFFFFFNTSHKGSSNWTKCSPNLLPLLDLLCQISQFQSGILFVQQHKQSTKAKWAKALRSHAIVTMPFCVWQIKSSLKPCTVSFCLLWCGLFLATTWFWSHDKEAAGRSDS